MSGSGSGEGVVEGGVEDMLPEGAGWRDCAFSASHCPSDASTHAAIVFGIHLAACFLGGVAV